MAALGVTQTAGPEGLSLLVLGSSPQGRGGAGEKRILLRGYLKGAAHRVQLSSR